MSLKFEVSPYVCFISTENEDSIVRMGEYSILDDYSWQLMEKNKICSICFGKYEP